MSIERELRVNLDDGEEVHRLIWEWGDMVGYKMRFSTTVVCTKVKTSPMEKYKHGWENDMDFSLTTLLLGKFPKGQVSWALSITHTRNLASRELQLVFLPTCPTYITLFS
jgi:hypothetical protein